MLNSICCCFTLLLTRFHTSIQEAILLDLLRVISHHRARLATPIRTIQKVYRDADLDDMPFSDSIYPWGEGVTSNRPVLLLEPSNKTNGEDKTKTQVRSPAHINGIEDEKAPPKSTQSSSAAAAEGKEDTKGETNLNVDSKPRETTTEPASKTKAAPKSEEAASHKPQEGGTLSTSQSKQDVRQAPPAKPSSLEENIVLGVALDGSKRTLPIDEEDTVPPSNSEDMKELAPLRSGNGAAVNQKENSDSKQMNTGGSPIGDNKQN